MHQHPHILTRDTATFPPFMYLGHRRKLLPRKLAFLTEEHLGLVIQNSTMGHSSVEDATGALRLYLSHQVEWETYAGHPLAAYITDTLVDGPQHFPLSIYLDACNLPMKLVGWRVLEETTLISSLSTRQGNMRSMDNAVTFDWIPFFQEIMARRAPNVGRVVIAFDGARFRMAHSRPKCGELADRLLLTITDDGISADDVLTKHVVEESVAAESVGRMVTLKEAASIFEGASKDIHKTADMLGVYIVVRRGGGGSRAHRKLFGRLNLQRPEEGALCLTALTPELRKHSQSIITDLLRVGADKGEVVKCEVKERAEARSLVVTRDILLAHRIVKEGGIVLNYEQMVVWYRGVTVTTTA
mmetsp:Transcript_22523/g.51569  ORF Transcript_22523/g.51569 Transcript_22523/m.51569 type:complete len:357 (-) Transcript_22523:107-1177(-)